MLQSFESRVCTVLGVETVAVRHQEVGFDLVQSRKAAKDVLRLGPGVRGTLGDGLHHDGEDVQAAWSDRETVRDGETDRQLGRRKS